MNKTKIRNSFEYQEFILWISLPKELRNPQTQVELSKKFGVGQDTLSDWKKKAGFWDEVSKQRKLWTREKTSDVIDALYRRILQTGNASEIKLWFQLVENWSEKIVTVDEQYNEFRNMTDQQLADFIKKAKAKFSKKD